MLQVKDDESDRYFNSCVFETWNGLFAKQSCFRNRNRSILIATWLWKCLKLHFCTATQFLLLFNWNYLLLRDGIYLNTSCTKRIPERLYLLLAWKIGPGKHRVGEVWRAIEKTNSIKQNKSLQFTGSAQLARISQFQCRSYDSFWAHCKRWFRLAFWRRVPRAEASYFLCDMCEKSDREPQQLSCPLLLTEVLLLSSDATLENLQLPDRAEPFTSSGTAMGHTVMPIDPCPKTWFISYISVLNYSTGKADHYSPVSHMHMQLLNEWWQAFKAVWM